MLEPDRQGDLAFVSVEKRRAHQAVERLKGALPDDLCECSACGYAAEVFRWGIKTYPAREPRHVVLVPCCPGCERPIDLTAIGTVRDGR